MFDALFTFLFDSVSLIGLDVGNTSTRISRFANYLRNLLPSNDVVVMEMAAQAVGKLALASGSYLFLFKKGRLLIKGYNQLLTDNCPCS